MLPFVELMSRIWDFSCKTINANLTSYGWVGCPFPHLENMSTTFVTSLLFPHMQNFLLCIDAQRKIVWYHGMSPISMFDILSRPVYKPQKQTLWRCCLPTTFHCLLARWDKFEKVTKQPAGAYEMTGTLCIMWDSTKKNEKKNAIPQVGCEWSKMVSFF